MPSWGYRVYTLSLKYGLDPLPLGESDIRIKIYELLRDVLDGGTHVGKPAGKVAGGDDGGATDDDESYRPSTPTLTIKNLEWCSDRQLHLIIGIGDAGLHEDLRDPQTQDHLEILGKSAEVPLRADIYFPDSGNKAILVSEVQGKSDPVDRLLRWAQFSWRVRKEQMTRARKQEIEQWTKAKDSGEAVDKKPSQLRLKNYYFKTTRLGDPDLLKLIIENADEGSVEFYELGVDGKKKHTLKRKMETRQELSAVGKVLTGGKGVGKKNLRKTAAESTLELAHDLEYDTDQLRAGGLDVDGSTVKLKTADGTATFRAGEVSDVFTYPFKKNRPKDYIYYSRTVAKISRLAPPASIEFSEPNVDEVHTWLQEKPSRSPSDPA